MDVAIVTGADTRFGDAVCRTLLKMGFRIHAVGLNPDASGYDERYYRPHAYGPGRLAELKSALEEALSEEGRLDLLAGLGGPEVTTGWEESSPEGLVRRLHGCLTEPFLAASVCLGALKKSKGFLIHGHRRPVNPDLSVSTGYFEDSMRRAYDDLFLRNADTGLRSARVLYAYPEDEAEDSAIHQDVADSVSRAFEIILRQKETCIVREMHISPRGLGPVGNFPNLVSGMDPYQTTVLPEGETETQDPILIPTERPKHYVQIAEVKDVTDGDVEVDDYYEDEQEDELDQPRYSPYDDDSGEDSEEDSDDSDDSENSSNQKPSRKRRRSRGRSRRKNSEGGNRPDSGPEKGGSKQQDTPPARSEAKDPGNSDNAGDASAPNKRSRRSRPKKPTPPESSTGDRSAPARGGVDPTDIPPPNDPATKPKKKTVRKSTRKRPTSPKPSNEKEDAAPEKTESKPPASDE